MLLVLGLVITDQAQCETVPDERLLESPADVVAFSDDTHDDMEEKPDVELSNQQPPLNMDAPNGDIAAADADGQPVLMSDHNVTEEESDPAQQKLQQLEQRVGELNRQLLTMAEQPAVYSSGGYGIHRGVG